MKKIKLLQIFALVVGLMISTMGWGQTTVFSDDFSTYQSATWTTSGQIGSSAISVSRSGADWGARRNTSPAQLELTNDASGSTNVNGWVFAYAATTNFSSPYNTTLSSNAGMVTWYFNIRTNRANLAGFSSGSYGMAYILAGSSTAGFNAGSGYAVVLGNSSTPDPFRLAKYNNGLSGTLTNLVSGTANIGTNYYSIKVTYDPINDQWELFVRDDGTTAFTDPTTGTLTSQGTATDNTYTSTTLSYMGGYWQGSTGAYQTAFFDNITVQVTVAGTPTITLSTSTLSGFTYLVGNGPSAEQSFTVEGSDLTDDITITPPTNYEISETSGSGFVSVPIILTQSSGSVAQTTIYVRLKAGLAVGTYNNEDITATSTDADNETVTCSGEVIEQIDWANLQWPANGNINLGGEFIVYAQVYEPGITNAAGQGAGITCWIGFSTANTDPSGWTNWVAATYNGDVGNNDEYKADIGTVISPAGTYYYASRFQLGSAPYVYGGYNTGGGGFWDGTNNISGTLTINPPPQIDWCNLQSPPSGNIYVGGTFNVYAQVYEAGVTNGAGQGAGISAWIGYNTSNTNPSTWENWVAASYNVDAGNNDEYMAEIGSTLPAGTYYYASRFKYGLAEYVYGGYSSGGGGFWDGTTYVSGVLNVTYAEPSNHVSNFTAIANSSSAITVSWNDSDASGYLIKGSDVGYGSITDPVDGTAESDGGLVKNIAAGNGTHQFTGLEPSTPYYFRIFPYNGSGLAINYKTDGSVPEDDATTQSPPTYTWIGADNASWAVSTNWDPTRTTPASNDILQFNDGTTKTVTSVPAQTIGKLLVTNNTNVTFQAGGANTLTIAGGTGDDLTVEPGSQLNVSGSTALQISLSTGATGSVSGSMTFAGAAHKLLAADASGITFNSGAQFTAGTGFSGNAFGTTNLSSIIFSSSSVYEQIAGSNPFGASQPNSVVVFQAGSLFSLTGNTTPAFSGRTYADFEFDFNGVITTTGGSAVSIDNLTIKQGTLNFNMTGTPGHSIKGNVEVLTGATLNFNPASAGTVNLNGSSLQIISGGGTISANSNSTITINNSSGVRLNKSASFNHLTIMPDSFFDIFMEGFCSVGGTLTNNAGAANLTIHSDATGTGSLIHATADVPATVERYITGHNNVNDAGWHLLGSPVAAFTIAGSSFEPGSNDDLYAWDEVQNLWLNYKAGNPTQIAPGTGYLVSYQNTDTKVFTGTLSVSNINKSNLSLTGGTNSGWHLLGNPFASALRWNDGNWALNNVAGTAKIWNAAGKSYSDIAASGIIPSSQGFMVQVSVNNDNSITIPAASRLHDAAAWYKSSGNDKIRLVAATQDGSYFQESNILLNPESTIGFDFAYDSRFLPGYAPQFYAVCNGEKLSTNSLPALSGSGAIPFGFVKNQASDYQITLTENIEGMQMILEDVKLNQIQVLNDYPVYQFISETDDDPNRFLLHFGTVGIQEHLVSVLHAYMQDNILYVVNPGTGKALLAVYNAQGQMVSQEEVGAGLQSMNLKTAPGVYIVRLITGTSVLSQKIVIQ